MVVGCGLVGCGWSGVSSPGLLGPPSDIPLSLMSFEPRLEGVGAVGQGILRKKLYTSAPLN